MAGSGRAFEVIVPVPGSVQPDVSQPDESEPTGPAAHGPHDADATAPGASPADALGQDGPSPEDRAPAAARAAEPTQADPDTPSMRERLDPPEPERRREDRVRDRRRQSWRQWFGRITLAVVLVATLVIPYLMLRSGREAQDRYAEAVEQLASGRREVRTAALHTLEHIAKDSPSDRLAVRNTLAAYIREHSPASNDGSSLPALDADVTVALTVLARLPAGSAGAPPLDLRAIRAPHSSLARADLRGAYLSGTTLKGADLSGAILGSANLSGADLRGANLTGADLSGTTLIGARLDGADLFGATLGGADLRGANLSTARGIVPEAIRAVAVTDTTTLF